MRLTVPALEIPIPHGTVLPSSGAREHFGLGPVQSLDRRAHAFALRLQRALLGHPSEHALLRRVVRVPKRNTR